METKTHDYWYDHHLTPSCIVLFFLVLVAAQQVMALKELEDDSLREVTAQGVTFSVKNHLVDLDGDSYRGSDLKFYKVQLSDAKITLRADIGNPDAVQAFIAYIKDKHNNGNPQYSFNDIKNDAAYSGCIAEQDPQCKTQVMNWIDDGNGRPNQSIFNCNGTSCTKEKPDANSIGAVRLGVDGDNPRKLLLEDPYVEYAVDKAGKIVGFRFGFLGTGALELVSQTLTGNVRVNLGSDARVLVNGFQQTSINCQKFTALGNTVCNALTNTMGKNGSETGSLAALGADPTTYTVDSAKLWFSSVYQTLFSLSDNDCHGVANCPSHGFQWHDQSGRGIPDCSRVDRLNCADLAGPGDNGNAPLITDRPADFDWSGNNVHATELTALVCDIAPSSPGCN